MAAKALNRMRIVGLSLPLRLAGRAIGFSWARVSNIIRNMSKLKRDRLRLTTAKNANRRPA
jgi:hypothetical protein